MHSNIHNYTLNSQTLTQKHLQTVKLTYKHTPAHACLHILNLLRPGSYSAGASYYAHIPACIEVIGFIWQLICNDVHHSLHQ